MRKDAIKVQKKWVALGIEVRAPIKKANANIFISLCAIQSRTFEIMFCTQNKLRESRAALLRIRDDMDIEQAARRAGKLIEEDRHD